MLLLFFFFFKQKTAYEMRISDWSSDVCSSDLKMRRHCVPLPDYAVGFVDRWFERAAHPDRGLLEAIGADMWEQVKVRSEERRVGKECVRTCRSRWSPSP